MSELKTYKMVDEKYCTDCVCVIPYEVYLKSEVDKVIAELKYKRSLDNVWWCRKLSRAYAWSASTHRGWKIAGYYSDKAELFRKWLKRWIKIAEKFKEAK